MATGDRTMTRISTALASLLFVPFVLFVLSVPSACAGELTLSEAGAGWRIGNAHYTAEIAKASGGLLSRLADADGRVLLDRFEIYTDAGVYGERLYYGTRHEDAARVRVERQGKRVVAVSEGRLLRDAEKPDYPLIRYRAELTFDDTAAVRVAITLTPELAAAPPSAFIAHIVGVADAPELFALTADGLLCQDAATRSTRTWQSKGDPLDRRRPLFGVCTSRRACLVFTDIRSGAGLANVFVHESGNKSLTAFFAWRDGPTLHGIAKGQALDLAYTIRLLDSPDGLGALMR